MQRTHAIGLILMCMIIGIIALLGFQKNPSSRYESVLQILETIAKTESPRAALDELNLIASSNGEIAGLCHGLAHEIGHAAFERFGFTGALAVQDDVCGSGYLHGIIEEELSHHAKDFRKHFKTLCNENDPRCFHGLGHGLMFVTENDLPEALKLCRTLSLPFQRIQCDEGVFMENFEADSLAHPSLYLYPADPYRTCRSQRTAERDICTFYFPRYFLQKYQNGFATLTSFCLTLPELFQKACTKGTGSAAMKAMILEPEKALEICNAMPDTAQRNCIAGLLSYRIVHYASIAETRSFCAEYLMPDWKTVCLRSLAEGREAYGE